MNSEQILSLVRTLIKVGGTYAAAQGLGDGNDWEAIAGAVAVIIGVVLSWRKHSNPTPKA